MHNVSVQQNQLFVVVVVAFWGGGGFGGGGIFEQSGRIRAEQMLITAWMNFLPQPVPRAKHMSKFVKPHCFYLFSIIHY